MAIMEAGFTLETSWPVHTQRSTSLHIAGQNAAESTVMLVCRKRKVESDEHLFFEDIEGEVRAAARRPR